MRNTKTQDIPFVTSYGMRKIALIRDVIPFGPLGPFGHFGPLVCLDFTGVNWWKRRHFRTKSQCHHLYIQLTINCFLLLVDQEKKEREGDLENIVPLKKRRKSRDVFCYDIGVIVVLKNLGDLGREFDITDEDQTCVKDVLTQGKLG